MSDNLEVAKECGATVEDVIYPEGTVQRVTFHTNSAFENYTSRILASQQAAHDAGIARLKEELREEQEAYECTNKALNHVLADLSAANKACAMKDEALKFYANGFHTKLISNMSTPEMLQEVKGEGWSDFGALYNGDSQYVEDGKTAREAISASSQQVSEWERKQLEPLRAQVAMLRDALNDAVEEYKKLPHSLGYTITHGQRWERMINTTQAAAEQFIAECEQRGAFKALEDAADRHWASAMEKCKRDKTNPAEHNELFYGIALLRNAAAELRATSKKAG